MLTLPLFRSTENLKTSFDKYIRVSTLMFSFRTFRACFMASAFAGLSILILLPACTTVKVPEISGMVFIPGGKFVMGSKDQDVSKLGKEYGNREGNFFDNSKPEKMVILKPFYIDKYEVTNSDYIRFVKQAGHRAPSGWRGGTFPKDKENHPVVSVSWYDAEAYCKWANRRLPTEAEWEKAARGPDGNKYPWGNVFDENAANLSQQKTVPAGSMPRDISYYGVYDMGGNISEWTSSWYKAYAGSAFHSSSLGETHKVARGGYGSISGHYNLGIVNSQSSHRKFYPPKGRGATVGFRCARSLK